MPTSAARIGFARLPKAVLELPLWPPPECHTL
jgi:hypothetical protein